MKSISQLKEEIYDEALNSGYFKNMQAQLKTYVYDLIEKEYNNGRNKTGFQYEHPLLPKLKKYPLTALCMDLIQEFLESFKFKHTLNVFRKEINRNVGMNRSLLAQSFKIEIKNPDSQAVLLSLVQQMVSGEVGAVRSEAKVNNYFQSTKATADRTNNFMGESKQEKKPQPSKAPNVPPPSYEEKPSKTPSNSNSNINSNSNSFNNSASAAPKTESNESSSIKIDSSKEQPPKAEQPVKQEQPKKDKKKDSKSKKPVVQKEKPPENATDLLGDVMKKFQGAIKVDKEKEKKDLFQSKRAFSEQKQKKVVDPSEQGANKIRGISMGKTMPSFMNKFIPQAQQPQKNESFIDEQLDEFQQSKDSTRKNPLFSSSESGFDKSGFDQSVDSNAIEEYEYIQRAKKFTKK